MKYPTRQTQPPPPPPPVVVLPISDVVYHFVAPTTTTTTTTPVSSSSTTTTTHRQQPPPTSQRYQFRHSIQIQQHTVPPSSSPSSSAVVLQTISTGDLIFVNVQEDDDDNNNNSKNNNNNDTTGTSWMIDHESLMKHYQKMFVPPPSSSSSSSRTSSKTVQWKVGYVMGFVSSFAPTSTSTSTSTSTTTTTTTTTESTTTTSSTHPTLQEDYRVIVTWLIPYTYIQEHDLKKRTAYSYLDPTAHRNIGKSVRPDGMLLRLPIPTHGNLPTAAIAVPFSVESTNPHQLEHNHHPSLRHLFQLFGPTTVSVSQIMDGTVIALIPHTSYDPKKSKLPREVPWTTCHNTTNTTTTSTTSTTSTFIPKCYEYHFHCPYALPMPNHASTLTLVNTTTTHHQHHHLRPTEPIRCTASDFIPQPLRRTETHTTHHQHHHHNKRMVVPPKIVADAWNFLRANAELWLRIASSSSTTTQHHNTNWFQHLFQSSMIKSTSPSTSTSIQGWIDALVVAMMKPYPAQHYIPLPHNKFQYVRFEASLPSMRSTKRKTVPPSTTTITAPVKRRKTNVVTEWNDKSNNDSRIAPTKKKTTEPRRTVTLSQPSSLPQQTDDGTDHHGSNIWSYNPKHNQHLLFEPVTLHSIISSKTKQTSTATPASTLYFYPEIDLIPSPTYTTTTTTRATTARPTTWTLHVGDIIAVEVTNDPITIIPPPSIYTISSQQPHNNNNNKNKNKSKATGKLQKQSPWFPFDRPWGAAQIVAIYEERQCDPITTANDSRTSNSNNDRPVTMMMMQVRWFYRPHDLPEDIVEELPASVRRDLFDDANPQQSHHSNQKKDAAPMNPLLLSGRQFIEVDEDVAEINVQAALGRIVVTSAAQPNVTEWNTYRDTKGNVDQLPIMCRYMYNLVDYSGVDSLVRIRDDQSWTNYSSSAANASLTQPPYHRGLICPKSYPGRIPSLFQAYGGNRGMGKLGVRTSSQREYKNSKTTSNEEIDDHDADGDDDTTSQWPEELLSSSSQSGNFNSFNRTKERVITIVQDPVTRIHRELLLSMPMKVMTKRCDPRATAKKSSTDGQQWTLQIGDIVAMAYNGAKKCVRTDVHDTNKNVNAKKRWYPFLGPWRVCQVLNIYRNVVTDKSGNFQPSGPTLLEVRWFLRKSELPVRVWEWMPPYHTEYEQDEVYESNLIDKGIPADHVIGAVALYLGEQLLVSNRKGEKSQSDVPEAECRCRYFYYHSMERFQPLFCSETTPRRWFQRMIERGFKLSPMTLTNDDLRQGIELGLDLRLSKEGDFFRSMICSEHELGSFPDKMFLNPCAERNQMNREYFLTTSVTPSWSKMTQPDFVCAESDRKGIRWTIQVGDIVAIEVPPNHKNREAHRSNPFTVHWKVAQVLAIYREGAGRNAGTTNDLVIQWRWFYRRSDHDVLHASASTPANDAVYSSTDLMEAPCKTKDLLGPVVLFPRSDEDRSRFNYSTIWKAIVPFMPVITMTYVGHFDATKKRMIEATLLSDVVRAGINVSEHYDVEAKTNLLRALHHDIPDELSPIHPRLPAHDENVNPNIFSDTGDDISSTKGDESLCSSRGKRGQGRTKAWTAVPPFYTDRANGKEYFSKLEVVPPFESYATECAADEKPQKRIWTIELGDVVIVHHEMCAGRTSYHASADERIKVLSSLSSYFPFTVPWAVAEIVHIVRHVDSLKCSNNELNQIKLEIRWLYRKSEISSKTIKGKRASALECEEICESDHYDEIEPLNILAPAHLHESSQMVKIGNRYNGMPLVEFHCSRFWSVYRKSLKPIGGLDGRIERGRLQSKSIVRDRSLKTALFGVATEQCSTPPPLDGILSFNDAFARVIHKLSLTDASKEAHDNSSALVGRESERKEISLFLRSCINKKGQGSSNRASLFIAGPPGTGKTACVLSVISEFLHEQSIGGTPGFDFIPLNCMEMRDPFEAYVKLWTHLEGENSRCNAETSASRLEAYFTGKFEAPRNRNPHVSVVLLDEIDYLVTKKQSVLYNFFDWPTRSMETQSDRRLVVIGISNTLNLPERLHPRVQSRIGSKRIFFKSYSVNETVAILNSKIQQASPNYEVFDSDAVLYASKKTAALSGDIRKAFHICRSAAEMILCDAENSDERVESPIVRIKDVLKVSRESTNAAQPRSVGLCAPFQVLFLVALAALSKTTGREYGGFDVEEITTKMRSMADAFGDPIYLPPPSLPETINMIARLRDNHLVAMTTPRDRSLSFRVSLAGSGGPWPLVSMVMDDLAIVMALKDTHHYELAQKFLSRSSY